MPNEFVIKNGFISQGNSSVTGNINVSSGLTATTISASTYANLPTDIYVTGGTFNISTGEATFNNTSGGTFSVSGFTSGFDYGKSYVIANNYQWF